MRTSAAAVVHSKVVSRKLSGEARGMVYHDQTNRYHGRAEYLFLRRVDGHAGAGRIGQNGQRGGTPGFVLRRNLDGIEIR